VKGVARESSYCWLFFSIMVRKALASRAGPVAPIASPHVRPLHLSPSPERASFFFPNPAVPLKASMPFNDAGMKWFLNKIVFKI
jgi:hypothetical protein